MTLAISVLIPAYNRAHFVGPAVQSALDQTYPPLEVVVVDDGSTDDTPDVMARFTDTRVRYIRQENKGICGAFNTAFRASRGDFIALLGSDDLWMPDLLGEEAPIIQNDPQLGVVYARAQAMDVDEKPLSAMLGVPEKFPGDTFKSLLYGDHICGIAALIRRESIERAGLWDEGLVANEDWDLWLRLSLVCRFHFVDKVLARFRVHGGNISSGRSAHFARLSEDRVKVLDKIYGRADLPPCALPMRRAAYRNVYMDVGMRWLSVRNWQQTLRYFGKAMRVAPNPYTAPLRILYLVVFYNYLSKRLWGVRLVNSLQDLRRKHGR